MTYTHHNNSDVASVTKMDKKKINVKVKYILSLIKYNDTVYEYSLVYLIGFGKSIGNIFCGMQRCSALESLKIFLYFADLLLI